MLRFLVPAAAALALSAAPAFAQFGAGPTPGEQNSMHTGTTASNGSSTIVTDRNGTHPDGFPGMAVVNHASGSSASNMHHRHHHRRHADGSEPSAR